MAAALLLGVGASTALSPVSKIAPREERASFGIHFDGCLLSADVVSMKQDNETASVASKPGHELLRFEALREGLEEEMDRDPRVCVMGEDGGSY